MVTCPDAKRLSNELQDFPPLACGGGGYLWGGFDPSRAPASPSAAADMLVAQTLAALHAPVRSRVIWVAIGALTNVAEALRVRPDLASKIEMLVVMGGSLDGMLELNFAADAAAARFVLALPGLRRVLLPLELGKTVSVTTAHLDALAQCVAAAPGPRRRFIAPHLPLRRRHAVIFGLLNPLLFGAEPDGPPIWERLAAATRWRGAFHPWDVLAAAYVTDRALFGPLQCWNASIAHGALTLSAERVPHACSVHGDGGGLVGVPESVDGARLAQLLVVRLCAVDAAAAAPVSTSGNGEL